MTKLNGWLVALVVCISAGVACSDIGINWSSSGAYDHGGTWGGGGWPDPSGLRQLIWSWNDPSTLVPDLSDPNLLDPSSHLLAVYTRAVPEDGAIWSAGDSSSPWVFGNASWNSNNVNKGYVYSRIFQDATPAAGEWYWQSAPTGSTLSAYVDTDPLSYIEHNTTGGAQVELNRMLVPEPGTWALMGIGAIALVARRMRRT